MKKYLSVVLIFVFVFLTGCEKVEEDIKLGIARYAAHGDKSFAVTTVVMKGDILEKVILDEYQYMTAEGVTCVPNGDVAFKKDTTCLASKRENNEVYSNNMATKGGATKDLVESYKAIEAYAEGKTIEELANFIEGKESADLVDAISGCTLQDTKGYIESIIEASNNAE